MGSESFVVRDEWERLNLARTLNAVGGGEAGYGEGEDEGTSRLGREENPPSDMGVEGVTDWAAAKMSIGLMYGLVGVPFSAY